MTQMLFLSLKVSLRFNSRGKTTQYFEFHATDVTKMKFSNSQVLGETFQSITRREKVLWA